MSSPTPEPPVVALYLVRTTGLPGPEAFLERLSAEERERFQRFLAPAAALQFAVGRTLLRSVLSARLGPTPETWSFELGAAGKPRLAAAHAHAPAPSFNLSHTEGLVALAVGDVPAIGVDVEHTLRRNATLEIADRFFAGDEVENLRALPRARQQGRFFDHWTLKESYIKARGEGLGLPLSRFGFRLHDEHELELFADPELDPNPQRFRFWLATLGAEHRLALAVEGTARVHVYEGPPSGPWPQHPLRWDRWPS
jgi:4'-phosphopantetheinyl transferase